MGKILQKLKSWRLEQAQKEKIEPFRVLSSAALEEIAQKLPRTHEQLLVIKGIKDKKVAKYGAALLTLISETADSMPVQSDLFSSAPAQKNQSGDNRILSEMRNASEKVFTVGAFLDLLNIGLRTSEAKIKGEVSTCDNRGNYLFFTLKDKADGSMLSCFMWRREYEMSGVTLAEGIEVIAHGFPEIYKPSGKLSFRTDTIELVGEGALKKAYDALRKKLEREGLFAVARKRKVPEYPEKIGLITSKTGAVIHDFLNNIGRFGYRIQFIDSRVEGQTAVADLLAAIKTLRKKNDIQALVIIRGGGSLESLQAFNNEMLVREIACFPVPVICGIGHDKDVSLASLAADVMVSTPTAVTRVLNNSWEQAQNRVRLHEQTIMSNYQESLLRIIGRMQAYGHALKTSFGNLLNGLLLLEKKIREGALRTDFLREQHARKVAEWSRLFIERIRAMAERTKEQLARDEAMLLVHNPERQLSLGYSIARIRGKIIRSIRDAQTDDLLEVAVADGMIETTIMQTRYDQNKHQ